MNEYNSTSISPERPEAVRNVPVYIGIKNDSACIMVF